MPLPQTTAALKATCGAHTFIVFLHDLQPLTLSVAERQLGAWASDKRFPFDWADAAFLSVSIRALRERAKESL